jgi:hypothetical protein
MSHTCRNASEGERYGREEEIDEYRRIGIEKDEKGRKRRDEKGPAGPRCEKGKTQSRSCPRQAQNSRTQDRRAQDRRAQDRRTQNRRAKRRFAEGCAAEIGCQKDRQESRRRQQESFGDGGDETEGCRHAPNGRFDASGGRKAGGNARDGRSASTRYARARPGCRSSPDVSPGHAVDAQHAAAAGGSGSEHIPVPADGAARFR